MFYFQPIYVLGIIIALLIIAGLYSALFTIEQQKIGLVERFGKFSRLARPGLNIKIPFIEMVVGTVDLRINELNVQVETKTLDNVFVKINVCVQYHAVEAKVFEAFYKLSNHQRQIQSYVFDVIRAQVPKMILDAAFEKKDDIANAVKHELSDTMQSFGYTIHKALVTDIDPDAKVKAAMNEINAAQRQRVAATEKGEADKILKIKQAEADAQSMYLNGEGIARARQAIMSGFRHSLEDLKQVSPDTSIDTIINLIIATQYFDTLKEIGSHNKSSMLLLPGKNPLDMVQSMTESVLTANLASHAAQQAIKPSKAQ